MFGSERQEQILSYLKEKKTVSVKKLTELFYISEATARRDLLALEKAGQCRRVFGGAFLSGGADTQVPLFVREREDEAEKNKLAAMAAAYLRDGMVLFLDGSSTVWHLLPYLKEKKDLIVITNGLNLATALCDTDIKTYVIGGLLLGNSAVLTGPLSEHSADAFRADLAILSCKGMDAEGRLTDTSESEAELRRRFLANSKQKLVLLTRQKLGKSYLHLLCHKEDVDAVLTLPDATGK